MLVINGKRQLIRYGLNKNYETYISKIDEEEWNKNAHSDGLQFSSMLALF